MLKNRKRTRKNPQYEDSQNPIESVLRNSAELAFGTPEQFDLKRKVEFFLFYLLSVYYLCYNNIKWFLVKMMYTKDNGGIDD